MKLSTTYKTISGDTWSSIARKTTGLVQDAARIKRANQSIIEPIAAGLMVQIPVSSTGIATTRNHKKSGLQVYVDEIPLPSFNNFTLQRPIDAFWQTGFNTPANDDMRSLFKPLSHPKIRVELDGETKFTGYALTPKPNNDPRRKELSVTCLSSPNVLIGTTMPPEAWPLEFRGQNLREIATRVCEVFGLTVVFKEEPGPVFPRVKKKQARKERDQAPPDPFSFLSNLAKQRGFIITNDQTGRVIFWKAKGAGVPVATVDTSSPRVESSNDGINESAYFSSVTCVIPETSKRKGAKYTIDNPFKTSIIRPYIFEAKDIDQGEIETATKSVAARMFGEVMRPRLSLSGWLDDKGKLYEPNTFILFKDPENYIPEYYKFLISKADMNGVSDKGSTVLELSLPGVYSGEIVERLPFT